MSTRTTLRPYQVIPNAQASPASTGSMATTITSAPTVLQSLTKVSYSVSWTGTSPVGTISVQASDDYALNPDGSTAVAGTWNTIPLEDSTGTLVTTIALTGNSGNGMIDIGTLSAYAVRLVYTRTSGTGTLTALVSGKVA